MTDLDIGETDEEKNEDKGKTSQAYQKNIERSRS